MSSTMSRTQRVWQDVLAKLRRTSICWRGTPLSDQDRATFTEAIVMWSLCLMDISSPYGKRPEREYIGWAVQMARLDVDALGNCLSDLVSLIRTVYKPMPEDWFKRQLGSDYPFIGVLLSPVNNIVAQFLQKPNAVDFTTLYQFFSFLTHLSLDSIQLDMEKEYVELEESLQSYPYDPSMLAELNEIMRNWFKEFTFSEDQFRPKHGPGACAELKRSAGNLVKYQVLASDQLLDYFVTKYVGASVRSFVPFDLGSLDRTSVLVVVAKSLKTKRTISKEPATLMYFQQAVKRMIVEYISRHEFLQHHIDFELQELNGELALVGSGSGTIATIDLSSASDRVTQTLVKSVFYGTPLYAALVSLRSHSVKLLSGRTLRLEKYAPMGSALCFPVQTLIFSSIIEYTVRRVRAKWGYDTSLWRVFGDDIIVEEPCYWDLIQNLKRAGFVVNVAKSYSQPYRFRESCGYEGYDGVEVTPMKISRRFKAVSGKFTSNHAPRFEGLVDMANNAYRTQLPLLRAWIISSLLEKSPAPPLFSETVNGALYSPWPDNFRAARRSWTYGKNRRTRPWFQVVTIQVAMASSTSPKAEDRVGPVQDARYFETLRLIEHRSGDMFEPSHLVQVPWGPSEGTLVASWVERPWL